MGAAQKAAARAAAQVDGKEPATDSDDEEDGYDNPISVITRAHFEAAVRASRRSVSDSDMSQYGSFAQSQAVAAEVQGTSGFSFHNQSVPAEVQQILAQQAAKQAELDAMQGKLDS